MEGDFFRELHSDINKTQGVALLIPQYLVPLRTKLRCMPTDRRHPQFTVLMLPRNHSRNGESTERGTLQQTPPMTLDKKLKDLPMSKTGSTLMESKP